MDTDTLDKMLQVLRKNGVTAFRNKSGEHDFMEIIMAPGDGLSDDEEDDEMEDSSLYNKSDIGITFKSFKKDEEEGAKIVAAHKRIITA